MTYQGQYEIYTSLGNRGRMMMCVHQQGLIFAGDGRTEIKALGTAVVAGAPEDIDAVIAAVCVGPNWNQLDDDDALLAAVQAVWPTVAAARYPT